MRRVLCVLAVAVMVFALVGCGGSESKYVGKWKLTKASYAGIEMTAKDMGMEATMEIKSNGEMVLELDGSKSEGNWEEKDGKLIIADDTNTGEKVTAEMKDGAIILEYAGVSMIFEK